MKLNDDDDNDDDASDIIEAFQNLFFPHELNCSLPSKRINHGGFGGFGGFGRLDGLLKPYIMM